MRFIAKKAFSQIKDDSSIGIYQPYNKSILFNIAIPFNPDILKYIRCPISKSELVYDEERNVLKATKLVKNLLLLSSR